MKKLASQSGAERIRNRGKRILALSVLVWCFGLSTAFAQSVTFNLKDADISTVIATIADITGKNFIIDPRVKGKTTVISSRPMTKEEAYQVFLSLLEVHGYAAVDNGLSIKILPDVNAKQSATPVATAGRPGSGDEMVTRVIDIEFITAAQLVPILRPLVPQQGHLVAYAPSNVLIISDRASNIQRLMSIIRKVDRAS
ncbi:MAG: type II secretion system protein GspD, partial [Gammaproteobacteria bacterium]|nr:type II secretion system protein GspD [Gammaproteobacteria bacterium]